MSRSDPAVTTRSGAPPLEVRDLAVEVGGRIVVEGLDLAVRPGDKVGVVGRNGAGKTSTLRVLAGELQPASGSVVQRGAVGYLRQDPRQHRADDAATGLEHVLTARGLVDLARDLEKSRLQLEESPSDRRVARFSRLEEEFRSLDGYRAEADAKAIAHGLGLPVDRLALPVHALSGGERRRLELARILFGGSDLLLLDEPTNHLDVDAKVWLMRFLTTYRGALLVVSHDIGLLDASITRIVHLGDGPPVEYRGTYTAYRAARAQDEERLAKVAGHARTARSGACARWPTRCAVRPPSARGWRSRSTPGALASKPTGWRARRASGRCASASRNRRTAGSRCSWSTASPRGTEGRRSSVTCRSSSGAASAILILGLNGAGKTSLLRIIAGLSRADEGAVRFGHQVRPGYYAQEHEGIQEGVEVLAHMKAESRADDQTLRSMLGMFGLPGEKAFQDAGTLSGGEKTKLALAQLVAGRYNLLLLDEPTNNLDPPSRDAVAEALRDWPGAMVIVSHDAGVRRGARARPGAADARRRPRPLGRRLPRPRRARLTAAVRRVPAERARAILRASSRRRGARTRRQRVSGNGAADLIFVNGAVYTVDATRRWAQAVAARQGRIVAVGSDADVAELRGDRTEVVDLGGRMLLPGFQDAHVHPVAAGLDLLRCDLHLSGRPTPTSPRSRRTPPRTRTRRGSSAADGRWTRSRTAPRRRSSSTRSCPTGPSTSRTATATASG